MKENINEKLSIYKEDIINTISELVQIPSVRNLEDKAEGAPFGKHIGEALDYVIDLGNKLGMRTYRSKEGYYGYLEVGDENLEEMVGIIGHLDVVPVGDLTQWNDEPFSGKVIDNIMYGRGSLDDKGPVVIAIYALKMLMDLNFDFKKRVRVILGTAEETTWEGMNEYIKNEEHPTIGFSPDAEFPVIYAEKSIAQMDAFVDEDVDFEISSLGAYNAVADSVQYKGNNITEIKAELDKLGFGYKEDGDTLIVVGKSAHAMAPELGINAIYRLCIALYNLDIKSNVINFIAEKVKETTFGELIAGNVEDDISGKLKFNIGRIEVKDGKGYIGIDTRIPVLVEPKEVLEKYEQTLKEYGFEMKIVKVQDKLYVEKDSFLVSTLLDVYSEVTGETNVEPLAIGGGTYARAFDNCVAYGALFVNQNQVDNMHQPNECMDLKFLEPALEIYANAIYRLSK